MIEPHNQNSFLTGLFIKNKKMTKYLNILFWYSGGKRRFFSFVVIVGETLLRFVFAENGLARD